MKQHFIQYTEALALKELGFKEPCFGWYKSNINHELQLYDIRDGRGGCMNTIGESASAPLYQQAFSFFREKYDLHPLIGLFWSTKEDKNFDYEIINHDQTVSIHEDDFKTYEEAEHNCLLKLIEIVKIK